MVIWGLYRLIDIPSTFLSVLKDEMIKNNNRIKIGDTIVELLERFDSLWWTELRLNSTF